MDDLNDGHRAEPVSEADAGIGRSQYVQVCRICHVPTRGGSGSNGNGGTLLPLHTYPKSRNCGPTCPRHGGKS